MLLMVIGSAVGQGSGLVDRDRSNVNSNAIVDVDRDRSRSVHVGRILPVRRVSTQHVVGRDIRGLVFVTSRLSPLARRVLGGFIWRVSITL